MTYVLLRSDGDSLLATNRPIVKANEREPLTDAFALLDRLQREHTDAAATRDAAEAEARARGLEQGYAEGRRAFAEAIAKLVEQSAAHRAREEEEVAMLALAALRQIAGELGDATIMQGVALRAARAVVPQGPVTVEVAPEIVTEVEEGLARLDAGADVALRADPTLGERQCRVTGPDSRIIADLDHQISELADRWKVSDAD